MYSRSFYPETEEKTHLPENYDGTAFGAPSAGEGESVPASLPEKMCEPESTKVGLFGGGLPILSGLFGGLPSIRMPKIGTEEILILTVAALLFFNKDGDRECAILLLALLFIG